MERLFIKTFGYKNYFHINIFRLHVSHLVPNEIDNFNDLRAGLQASRSAVFYHELRELVSSAKPPTGSRDWLAV